MSGIVILIPVYNDWPAVRLLLQDLEGHLSQAGRRAHVVLVDDGSVMDQPRDLRGGEAVAELTVLRLRCNLGHQRAIAIGLAYVSERLHPAAVVVMDGDGEDAPGDVPRLLEALDADDSKTVIFAERRRRSEGPVFAAFYALYRAMHRFLTGIPVRVGNFSAVPAQHLRRLVVVSELWNHYAAAVFKARLPRKSLPTVRARRLSGQSRMNFVSLVAHGLSALSVHAEVIGVRLLVLALFLSGLLAAMLAGVVAVRLFTPLAIPGWATAASGLLVVLFSQVVAFAILFVFLVLHARSQPAFIPIRDYVYFVDDVSSSSETDGPRAENAAMDGGVV